MFHVIRVTYISGAAVVMHSFIRTDRRNDQARTVASVSINQQIIIERIKYLNIDPVY